MHAVAEVLRFEQAPILEVVEPQPRFYDADVTNELHFVRLRARIEAEKIMAGNLDLLMQGEFDSVPTPVDPLGTARRLDEARKQYGENSEEYQELWSGLLLDCQRLFAEAYRKNSWEYFPEAVHKHDPKTGKYYSHGQEITGIVAGGLSPVAEEGEQPLRIDDFVEEVTYEAIGNMDLDDKEVSVHTFLECPDWAIEAYRLNPKHPVYGYVPPIEKLMLRGMKFNNALGYRVGEQLGLSGKFIRHEVIVAVLKETGRLPTDSQATKAELHGKQFIDTENDDVIELAKLLDSKASEMSGKTIFMGEEVAANHPRDYSTIKTEAQQRAKDLQNKSHELAEYVVQLQENGTDRWLANGLVGQFVKKNLHQEARKNPEVAGMIFDEATALGYRQVAELEALGRQNEAMALRAQVEANAPEPSFCGAGSCGLEEVKANSKEAEKMKEMGLDPEQAIKDRERKCKNCGQKTVVYDIKNKKKGCTNCDATTKY